MRSNVIAFVTLGVSALGLLGCSQSPLPSFDVPQGDQVKSTLYPAGPYGVRKGSTIADYRLVGYANAAGSSGDMQPISLGDFYNPHGRDTGYRPACSAEDDRVFPAGSPYGEGKRKPTVLAIDVAAMWCGPCNYEAKCELPGRYARYSPCGGEILLQLVDGPVPNVAATQQNLYTWAVDEYKEAFPATIDPKPRRNTIYAVDAFPQNVILDTSTMSVVEVVGGVPGEDYWTTYEGLLADPTCPARQPIPPPAAGCR